MAIGTNYVFLCTWDLKATVIFLERSFLFEMKSLSSSSLENKRLVPSTHCMGVAVCSMLIAGGLVAAVSRGPSVHEPETHK